MDSAVRLLNLLALVCGVGAMAAAVYLRWRRRSEFETHMGIALSWMSVALILNPLIRLVGPDSGRLRVAAALTSLGLILFVFFHYLRRAVLQHVIARQRAVERQRG
jgi:hypothetical protein